ncbi:hypothetical protein [Amycolatopsis sp. NPDC059657]|uniref:hypothetical protein n=1 Tax=Amycolatopsis sp. NPDC059657 TaxID=3346899 RepID=UPI00366D3394
MLDRKKPLKPVVSRKDRPGPNSEFFGRRAVETAHLTSVPELARHLVATLPDDYEQLRFSAVVYRYLTASPWLIDIAVFGVEDEHIDTELGDMVLCNVGDTVESHNWVHNGVHRFARCSIVLLTDEQQATHQPSRVAVRHFHLAERVRSLGQVLVRWLR